MFKYFTVKPYVININIIIYWLLLKIDMNEKENSCIF